MGTRQKVLALVFRAFQPETLYEKLVNPSFLGNYKNDGVYIELEDFQRIARNQFPAFSHEEIDNIYAVFKEELQAPVGQPNGWLVQRAGAFYPLVRMGQRILRQSNGRLTYDFPQALAWRNVYQEIGQDIITTAFSAYNDICQRVQPRREFRWEAVIKPNDTRLIKLLGSEMAENHCHLGGTTQNFPITWACLMNYPRKTIEKVTQNFRNNLHAVYSRGISGNVWQWDERLYCAACVRAELFSELESVNDPHRKSLWNLFVDRFGYKTELFRVLNVLQSQFGVRVNVLHSRPFVLDYSLRYFDCQAGLLNDHNRLLSGERSFLYRCFRACFDGTLDVYKQGLFYLYLLIKANFRAEIVQVNRQPGFYNFKEYQDRKDFVYDIFPGYRAEALRLSICAPQQTQNIRYYEARIAPKLQRRKLVKQVRETDAYVHFAQNGGKKGGPLEDKHFYVYHFIKSPDNVKTWKVFGLAKPRNHEVRDRIARQAKALYSAFRTNPHFSERVLGIDAANLEIGCRPEVFAPVFRYLSSLSHVPLNFSLFNNKEILPKINITYHAGEDFLDIPDGLRAIDEAICFLGLKRGDRIGHALALGVDPFIHYPYKQRAVFITKQDRLDNLVWMIYRSLNLGVSFDSTLVSKWKTEVEGLLVELYGNNNGYGRVSAYEYYCSMQLRGDDPSLYWTVPYSGYNNHFGSTLLESFYKDPEARLDAFRSVPAISSLCHLYHYDTRVREVGSRICEIKIDEEYMRAIQLVQRRFQELLHDEGIAIECNPTSNYLIGTFRRYDRHPILQFNSSGLCYHNGARIPGPQISVSINTDDLGVFDTSLENEYAIMAAAMERDVNDDGTRKYDSDSIYTYLDNLRENGLNQSFMK